MTGEKNEQAAIDPRELPEEWAVSQGTHEGRAMVLRFNRGLAAAAGHCSYTIQIGVAIPLKKPDKAGLPGQDESTQLAGIEDEVVRVAGDRAVLAGVITTSGMREFVLYTATAEWIEQFHMELQRRITHHKVQVMAKKDPTWRTYKTYVV